MKARYVPLMAPQDHAKSLPLSLVLSPHHTLPLRILASQQGCKAGCDWREQWRLPTDWRLEAGSPVHPSGSSACPKLGSRLAAGRHAAGPLIPSSPPFPFCPGCCVFSEKNRSVFSAGTNDKPGGPHYILRWTSLQVIKETHKPLGDWSYAYMQ